MRPTPDNSEVSIEFKLQVIAKVITMSLLLGTIILVNFRIESVTQAIRWADWAILSLIGLIGAGFLASNLLNRSQDTWHMLGRWGWPLAYVIISLALAYKP